MLGTVMDHHIMTRTQEDFLDLMFLQMYKVMSRHKFVAQQKYRASKILLFDGRFLTTFKSCSALYRYLKIQDLSL